MNDRFTLPPAFEPDPPRLFGSHDAATGQTYFPPRPLSVDGELRPLVTVALPDEGVLYSYARLGRITYGQVDLDEQVRVLTVLAPGEYDIGARCRLEQVPAEAEGEAPTWRFTRA